MPKDNYDTKSLANPITSNIKPLKPLKPLTASKTQKVKAPTKTEQKEQKRLEREALIEQSAQQALDVFKNDAAYNQSSLQRKKVMIDNYLERLPKFFADNKMYDGDQELQSNIRASVKSALMKLYREEQQRIEKGGTVSGAEPYFGLEGTVPDKTEAINRFVRTARVRIQDTLGVPMSADVFGIILTSEYDGRNLGQDWYTIGLAGEDSVCPMIYPSHYAQGTVIGGITFDKPDLYPYDMMIAALSMGSSAWYQEGYCTVRPYVQAFTAYYLGEGNYLEYDYDAINAQIRAIQDMRLDEYILWNASVIYPEGNYGGNDDPEDV